MENIEGKVENAGYQHFLLFPEYLLMTSVSEILTLTVPFTKIVGFVDSVDQDQAAQNDFLSILSTLEKHC